MDPIELIVDFLDKRLGVEARRVVPEAVLAELGVDSLMLLELMFQYEDAYGIKLSQDIKPPKTVGELVALMAGLIGRQKT